MISEFRKVEYFSATTDIWTRSNRSFIAVSVHYYDDNLTLKSAFIACENFEGSHITERVGEKLRAIFDKYGIIDKVFYLTTDGAGEFVSALKSYGDDNRSHELLNEPNYVDWMQREQNFEPRVSTSADKNVESVSKDAAQYDVNIVDSDLDELESEEEEGEFIRISCDENPSELESFITHNIFNDDDREPLLGRMNRIACSSHRLEKIGRIDSEKATDDPDYKKIHDRAFKVLHQIWDQKNSRINAEFFFTTTGKRLIGPHRIRWNKTYDAVSASGPVPLSVVVHFFIFFSIVLRKSFLFQFQFELTFGFLSYVFS